MAFEDNNRERHGGATGAAWIVFAIVIALLVVTAIYWSGHNSKTASTNSGTPTQTTGSSVNSRSDK